LLIARNVSVIVAMGTPGLHAVQEHTRTVPVVFTLVADPVRLGLIQSLSRPGGHATGFTNFELSMGGEVAGASARD
jgi:putative ABC transport system substrate-binding protein